MTDVLAIALSGLNAQQKRLLAAASNIAHATSSGPVPEEKQGESVSSVYKPLGVSLTALASGGVYSEITENKTGYSLSYDPSHVYANIEGYIARPNVDLAQETVDVMVSKTLFKANLSVIKTEREMQEDLLDILT
jgi:flagellar basal-body rod protein FlgC